MIIHDTGKDLTAVKSVVVILAAAMRAAFSKLVHMIRSILVTDYTHKCSVKQSHTETDFDRDELLDPARIVCHVAESMAAIRV